MLNCNGFILHLLKLLCTVFKNSDTGIQFSYAFFIVYLYMMITLFCDTNSVEYQTLILGTLVYVVPIFRAMCS